MRGKRKGAFNDCAIRYNQTGDMWQCYFKGRYIGWFTFTKYFENPKVTYSAQLTKWMYANLKWLPE